MQRALLFLLLVALSGCASKNKPRPGYYGGDGSSWRNPVVIVRKVDDYTPGRWLEQKYPGCFVKAILAPPAGVPSNLSIYRIRKRNGKVIELWFKVICIDCPVVV